MNFPHEGIGASEISIDSLAGLSTQLLEQELRRRQDEDLRPACGSDTVNGVYNTPLHVAALFIILILSVLACSFPITVRRFPSLPIPHRILFLSRHFGTGVLIATAFCHLLPTAFVSLTDPCLPPFWSERYNAFPGLVAMMSVFVVIGIEMFFATRGAGHSHGHDFEVDQEAGHKHAGSRANGRGPTRPIALKRYRTGSFGSASARSELLTSPTRPHAERTGSAFSALSAEGSKSLMEHADKPAAADEDSDLDLDELGDEDDPFTPTKAKLHHGRVGAGANASSSAHNNALQLSRLDSTASTPDEQKEILQCMLLEAGILFHSVFIGMALSVATGTGFIVLLVAISFHQTFEGLALGSRIAAIRSFAPNSAKPWLMALAYGTTTPAGQAIGLLVHNLYDPQSQMGLIMVGTTNAISSGLLLFAGLVELLAEDFLSDKSYESLKGRKRLEACGAVVAGSLLMALVGAWA